MIAKAKSCIGGTALIGYVVNEKKGYELERSNLAGDSPAHLYRSMKVIQDQNLRCKNNTISIVLSPDKNDGNMLTKEQWLKLSRNFLNKLGVNIEDAQYISFIHTEKEHKHLHIILNRVRDDGSLLKDHFIGKKAQHVAHKIAKEMNLLSAKEIKKKKELELKSELKTFRLRFRDAHQSVKAMFPSNIEDYSSMMRQYNFRIIPYVNKQGQIQGYKIGCYDNDMEIKLSLIDRKIKLNGTFFKSMESEKQLKKAVPTVEEAIIKQHSFKIKR